VFLVNIAAQRNGVARRAPSALETYHAFWQHVAFLPHGTFRKRNPAATKVTIVSVLATRYSRGPFATEASGTDRATLPEYRLPRSVPETFSRPLLAGPIGNRVGGMRVGKRDERPSELE
jgi:hypothetical protein